MIRRKVQRGTAADLLTDVERLKFRLEQPDRVAMHFSTTRLGVAHYVVEREAGGYLGIVERGSSQRIGA